MHKDTFIGEKFVSHIWDGGHFTKDCLRAKDGRRIEIIYPGQWNSDSGADFRNAEIRIDGETRKGDIEVHVKSSCWESHRHDADPRYNNTILHVALWDDGFNLLARKENGKLIPTLILCDHLDSSIGKLWKTIEGEIRKPHPCYAKAEMITSEAIGAVLDRAGMDRFLFKAKIFEERLEENNQDQLLYEGIMEALGYSKNTKQFLELAGIVPLGTLLGKSSEEIQAILFGVAGLLPSQKELDAETEEYLSKIEAFWRPVSSQFQDRLMFGEQWEFFGIRPENFPTRRIAGMSYILSNCVKEKKNTPAEMSFMAMFLMAFNDVGTGFKPTPMEICQEMRDKLIPQAHGYWTKHYTFGDKRHKDNPFLIGRDRAGDIVINIVLPMALAYARKSQDQEIQRVSMKVYASYQRLQDNKITRYFINRIFRNRKEYFSVVNSAMRQQGLIHLYKSFCIAGGCQNCPIME